MINDLIEIEQRKYPYYDVIGINIHSYKNGVVSYSVEICSRIDTKWRKWEPVREADISDIRDERINTILDSLSQK